MTRGTGHLAWCPVALSVCICSFALLAPVAAKRAGEQACLDEDPLCEHWSRIAECVANPYFMRKACAKSCQAEPVCALRPVWPAQWPGHATEAGTRLYALQVQKPNSLNTFKFQVHNFHPLRHHPCLAQFQSIGKAVHAASGCRHFLPQCPADMRAQYYHGIYTLTSHHKAKFCIACWNLI